MSTVVYRAKCTDWSPDDRRTGIAAMTALRRCPRRSLSENIHWSSSRPPTENTGRDWAYLRAEQRSHAGRGPQRVELHALGAPGCSAGRRQQDLRDETLAMSRPGSWPPAHVVVRRLTCSVGAAERGAFQKIRRPWAVTTIGGGDITTRRISSPLSRMTMRFSIANGTPSSQSVFVPLQSGLTV